MGNSKIELAEAASFYQTALSGASAALQAGDFLKAIEHAQAAWPQIDGMIQYARKYEEVESVQIEALDIVLDVAPAFFFSRALDELEALLKSQRRIAKYTAIDYPDRLKKSRELMMDAHRLWNHLERHPDLRQNDLSRVLGGSAATWNSLLSKWLQSELVDHISDGTSIRLNLHTRMGDRAHGKCSLCGSIVKGAKRTMLHDQNCPNCRSTTAFVIITNS